MQPFETWCPSADILYDHSVMGDKNLVSMCFSGKQSTHRPSTKSNMFRKTTNYSLPKIALLGIAFSFTFSQCSQNSQVSADDAVLKVLIVGGGESHDFDTWFNEA